VDGTGRETDTAGLEGVLVAVDPVRVPVVYGVETGPRTAEVVSVSISASPRAGVADGSHRHRVVRGFSVHPSA